MSLLKKIDRRFGDSTLWQFVKFNLVSFSITLLQLALANLLPLIFDGVTAKLPLVMRPVFRPDTLFEGPSPYVVDGVVTWGYVLPFFLSNFIANIYGYFMNMKTTFRGKGSRRGLAAYLLRQIDRIRLCGAGQDPCRHGRGTCAGGGVVPARKICVV